jgi:hypothetical protein
MLPIRGADGPERGEDLELDAVTDAVLAADPTGIVFGDVLRETYDQLYDPSRTGRYSWTQLRKTEKTHMGTLVEINVHRAYEFNDGTAMDYEIAGVDVDCKYSQTLGGWEFPPEAYDGGHLCLVVWASDELSRFHVGLVRATPNGLGAPNRDMKRKLVGRGMDRVRWLFRDAPLPENLLLHLDEDRRERIFAAGGRRNSGQRRVDMLFRLVQQRLVNRASVEAAAQQKDPMKRARDARKRDRLGGEGILVLGHQEHDPDVARDLGLPVPGKGQFVSARVVLAEGTSRALAAEIEGEWWRLASEDDPVVPAPLMPRVSRRATEE